VPYVSKYVELFTEKGDTEKFKKTVVLGGRCREKATLCKTDNLGDLNK